jgi:hypothetical protein
MQYKGIKFFLFVPCNIRQSPALHNAKALTEEAH